jgi:hypothetical protein
MLGHASIQLTVDTYGKWLPMGNKAAVDALDDEGQTAAEKAAGDTSLSESGSKMVANQIGKDDEELQLIGFIGESSRNQTSNLLITDY